MEIRICYRAQGWRWRLDDADAVEVWVTATRCLTLTGASVSAILEHHIHGAEMLALTGAAITATGPERILPLPAVPTDPAKPPGRLGPRTAAGQQTRRLERRTRAKTARESRTLLE